MRKKDAADALVQPPSSRDDGAAEAADADDDADIEAAGVREAAERNDARVCLCVSPQSRVSPLLSALLASPLLCSAQVAHSASARRQRSASADKLV